MEETTQVDISYKNGFEIGYWLRRGDNPHLKDIVHSNANGGPYHSGLVAGKKEAEREAVRERLSQIDKGHENDKGIEME